MKLGCKLSLTLSDDNQAKNAKVGVHDAPTDRFAFTLASTARAVAGVSLAEEETHTTVGQHTLFHREALFVIASTDADNIALRERTTRLFRAIFPIIDCKGNT